MQPYLNMGIRYRTYFERIGPSPRKLHETYRRIRRKLKFHLVSRDISYSQFKDYMNVLKEMKRTRSIDEHYFAVNVMKKQRTPWRW